MHIKNIVQRREFLAVFFGCLVSVVALYYLFQQNFNRAPDQQGKNTASFADQENGGSSSDGVVSPLPIRLRIAKIGVDAAIDPVGITTSGEMVVPNGPRTVGWFSEGPHPGDIGSAVIDGHYGTWKNGDGSVFDNLDKLKIGDTVSVENEAGAISTFVVRELRAYDPNADTSDIFSSDDEKAHLNLITCEGIWDAVTKSYAKRLVLFTDLVQ